MSVQSTAGSPGNFWRGLWLCRLWSGRLRPGWGGGGRPGWRKLGPTQEADKEEAGEEEHFWNLRAQWAGEQSHDRSRQWDPLYRHAREVSGGLTTLRLKFSRRHSTTLYKKLDFIIIMMLVLQLRAIPVKPAEDDELEEEAEWIFRHGFSTLTISMQVKVWKLHLSIHFKNLRFHF